MGAVVAGLGAVALYGALQIQNLDDQGLRSYTFPLLIGLLLLATGGTLATSAYRAGQDKPLEWPDQAGFRRMAVVLGSVALFVALMEFTGFPLGAAILLAFQVWYLGRDRWYVPVAAGLLTGIVIYVVFIKVLGLTLPAGPLL